MSALFEVTVDSDNFRQLMSRLESNMKPQQFERAMYGIFQRTGRHVATILKKDLPQKYEVKPSDVGASVKSPSVTMGSGGAGCIIPIVGVRGKIGSQYRAAGGAHGWNSVRRKYKVKALAKEGNASKVTIVDLEKKTEKIIQ